MTTETVLVDQDVWIDAAPEQVYPYLVEPERIVRWMGRSVELSPAPGGVFRCVISDNDTFRGEIVALEPNSRLEFTFGWEGEGSGIAPGASTVEITLSAEAGGTRVRLVHRDMPAASAEAHVGGWRFFLDRLAIAAVGGEPDATAEPPSGEM